jgi:putative restriction endonuclease
MSNQNSSKHLFNQLAKRLKKSIAGLSVSESNKWYSFNQKGGKKFAYLLLGKQKVKLDIWCLGNPEFIKDKYASKINFKLRQSTIGGFGKDFQIAFAVENQEDIENASLLLIEVSNSWSKEELMSAFNLFCRIPINQINQNNKKIIEFANLLEKTPKEVVKRFSNFSKFDASLNVIDTIEKEDKKIWEYFNKDWEKSVHESENKIIELENRQKDIAVFPKGKERASLVKSRVNQTFFRDVVLSSYQNRCCITRLPFYELLNASHIIPWSVDPSNRLNPHNGLSLNTLHDRAFDRGLITVMPNYTIRISSSINEFLDYESVKKYFLYYHKKNIILPNRFLPDKSFLEYHNKNIYREG